MSDALTYLMGNRWTKDAEGEFITVEDSHAVPPVSLSADGKSTQVTTTGKNLFDYANASSGYYDGQTGTFETSSITKWASIPVVEGDKIYWANMTNNYPSGWSNGEFVQLAPLRPASPITIPGGVDEVRVYATRPTDTAIVTKNNSDLTYEPYTGGKPSPSPDYPQEIVSIDGMLLKTCAKNFVPSDDPENPNANYAFNSSKHVIWDSENEGFRLTDSGSGVAMTAHVSRNPRAAFVAPKDGVYTFGVETKYYTSGTDFGFRVELNGTVLNGYGWGSPKQSSNLEWTRHSITRTLSKGDRFGATIYQTCLWRNISVVEGSEDVYQPYSGINVSNLLPDGYSLRSLPDGTKDELHLTYLRPSDRPGWAWYSRELVQAVWEFIADGDNEGWKRNHESVYYRTSPTCKVDVQGAVEFMSPQFAPAATRSLAQARNAPANSVLGRAGEKDIVLRTGAAYATLAEFTAWLSENPVTIYFSLETPIVTELDPIELPSMQQGLTNLWSDPSTNLSVTYDRDRNIVISNMKAALDELATS